MVLENKVRRRFRVPAKTLAKENREAQQAYRERHGEDLRKARRVASALMALRTQTGFDGSKQHRMNAIFKKLEEFFAGDEMRLFIATAKLTPAQRRTKAAAGLVALEEKWRRALSAKRRKAGE
jgi:hypothetical protein